jgi:hypothetical protein
MRHLNEEELVEHYYSRDAGADAAQKHLEQCAQCAEAFETLEDDLGELVAMELPVRDAAYGERVWQSIASALPAYEARKWNWFHVGLIRGLSYAAACALLASVGFFAGRQWEHKQLQAVVKNPPSPVQERVAPPQQPERVVVVVLSDHLDRSERLLVELKHADADSAETVSPLRAEARSLLAANRICRKDAKKTDDPELQSALEHLDRVLAELASQQGSMTAADLTRLQDEMSSDGLLFQVRVLRSRIPDRRAAQAAHSEGGEI